MRLTLVVLTMLPIAVAAETAYVTDNLKLGLYEAEDTSGRAFDTLDSGQSMEILIQGGNYANVRLPDGTEGWVKSAYLVSDKPAKLIVEETAAERDALAAELEQAKEAFAEPAATIDSLRSETSSLTAQLENAQGEVAALQEENASIQGMKDQYKGSMPLSWVGGATLVCLVVGLLGGLWWADYRNRMRHGGIRIY